MGKTLIIAEKPSQARDYAKALNVRGKGEGYLESDEYVITWCVGHLLELEKPEKYMDLAKVGNRWSLNRLPVLPAVQGFKYALKPGTRAQYQVIEKLLKSAEIENVICGTDADREGQLLFQEVWDRVKCRKPLLRLWVSSLTSEAIREGMQKLRPAQRVAGLAAAGYGRAYADWDFGMNLTEGFTSLFGSFDAVRKKPNVISIGRVQTPTLALVVEREWEIERFVGQKYFEILAEFLLLRTNPEDAAADRETRQATSVPGSYRGKWFDPKDDQSRILDKDKAESIIAKVNGKPGVINKSEEKEIQEAHPLLFDLTALTVAASRRFGFGAEKVLSLAQSLYEKKAITYPRTDCNYLPEDILPKLPAHLAALGQGPYAAWADKAKSLGLPRGKRVINTITAHHAIIPTNEKVDPGKLSPDEAKLFDMIARRFLAVWFPPARYKQTEVITEVAGESFRTRGKALLELGWKEIYSFEDENAKGGQAKDDLGQGEDKGNGRRRKGPVQGDGEEDWAEVPLVSVGEEVEAKNAWVEEKESKPPKRYTQADLLKAMESAGKNVEDEVLRQQLKGKGLGTVATRPAIIGNLLDRGYLVQEQKVLVPTAKGMELIRLIRERLPEANLLVSAEMTGQMEFDLARVERGELSLEQYMAEVENAIRRIIEELRAFAQTHGKAPLALAPTANKRGKEAGKKSGDSVARSTKRRKAETSKAGRGGEQADLEIDGGLEQPGGKSTGTEKEPSATNQKVIDREPLGACPRCGGDIIEGQKGYGCSNWRQGCNWVVWKSPICGKSLTPAQIKSLLKKGKTPLIKGFTSKTGKPFDAYLIWDDKAAGKLKFEFQAK